MAHLPKIPPELHIVGLAGPKGHGKSTLARAFYDALEEEGLGSKTLAFAGPLKDAARILWGLSAKQLHGDLKEVVDERWGATPRQILQHLGTEHARHICPQVHIYRLLERALETYKGFGTKFIIVEDVRFPNEYDALKAAGAKLCWVYRPQTGPTWDPSSHASEGGLVDHVAEGLFDLEFVELVKSDLQQVAFGALDSWGWV